MKRKKIFMHIFILVLCVREIKIEGLEGEIYLRIMYLKFLQNLYIIFFYRKG